MEARLIACVLLPLSAAYYLSYLFRGINALFVETLANELELSPADLGLLTSVYFLVMAIVQLPMGALLDRYGPRYIQSLLLLATAMGAGVFASAQSLAGLMLGRALIGLGVATALMAGLKAVVLWIPLPRIAVANGCLVTLGALGAVTATIPADHLIGAFGWRGVFVLLGFLTLLCAALIYFVVPEPSAGNPARSLDNRANLSTIYSDPRFWRLAPLSASCIGTSWALQGLWAAPWLTDVEGYDRDAVVRYLFIMALVTSASAILLGLAADHLRRRNVKTEILLTATLSFFIVIQLALVLRWPVPSWLIWSFIAATGATTVLTYTILPRYFPKEASARANAALDLLHVGTAFMLQWLIGVVIGRWPNAGESYPPEAYQTAFAVPLVLEIAALLWFVVNMLPISAADWMRTWQHGPEKTDIMFAATGHQAARGIWALQLRAARVQVKAWRLAALVSASILVCLIVVLVGSISTTAAVVYVIDAEGSTNPEQAGPAHYGVGAAALIAASAVGQRSIPSAVSTFNLAPINPL
jgi:MFS family permease